MNVNFYVTCIADVVKSGVAKNTVLLLEKLGCNVIFLEKQGCCGQPALNSGYTKQAIPGMKNLVETFEVNDIQSLPLQVPVFMLSKTILSISPKLVS